MKLLFLILFLINLSFLKAQDFNESALGFEQELFAIESSEKNETLIKYAEFALKNDSFKLAEDLLYQAYQAKTNDTLLLRLLQLAVINFNPEQETNYIDGELIALDFDNTTNQILQFSSVYFLQKLQFNTADIFISELSRREITDPNFLADTAKLKLKSIKKAMWLNRIIPGLGNAYSGKKSHALLNFALLAGGISLTYYQISQQNYFTAFFSGFGFSSRLYLGGNQAAKNNVISYNYKTLHSYSQQKILTLSEMAPLSE